MEATGLLPCFSGFYDKMYDGLAIVSNGRRADTKTPRESAGRCAGSSSERKRQHRILYGMSNPYAPPNVGESPESDESSGREVPEVFGQNDMLVRFGDAIVLFVFASGIFSWIIVASY